MSKSHHRHGMNEPTEFTSTLANVPSGHLGKLLIYKSGKVKLRIGDILFDVSTGMRCNFLQEVVAVNESEQKYYQLGDIAKRMVCYPDIESTVAIPHNV